VDIVAELEAALIGPEPDMSIPAHEQEIPLDADQATRWLAQLDSVRRKRHEVTVAFGAAVKRMKDVVDARVGNLDEQEAWLEEALAVYHEIMLAEDPEGAKTITLPTGTLKSGTWGGDVWTWTEEAFEPWAMENLPGAVEYPPPKVSKTTAKKLIKEATVRVSDGVVQLADGTTVPGLTVAERARQYKAVTEHE